MSSGSLSPQETIIVAREPSCSLQEMGLSSVYCRGQFHPSFPMLSSFASIAKMISCPSNILWEIQDCKSSRNCSLGNGSVSHSLLDFIFFDNILCCRAIEVVSPNDWMLCTHTRYAVTSAILLSL